MVDANAGRPLSSSSVPGEPVRPALAGKRESARIGTMLIVMHAHAGQEEIARVCRRIEELGFRPHVMPGAERTAIGITGNHGPVPSEEFEGLPGVIEAIPVSKPYKLVS